MLKLIIIRIRLGLTLQREQSFLKPPLYALWNRLNFYEKLRLVINFWNFNGLVHLDRFCQAILISKVPIHPGPA